jgi:hypothetical protein
VRTIRVVMTSLNPSVNYTSLWEVQAGLNPTALTVADAARALAIAGGLQGATPPDLTTLNVVESGVSRGAVDVADAVRVLRVASGLEL